MSANDILADAGTSFIVTLRHGAGNLIGGALSDTLVGGSGNDVIEGHGGADVLTGGGGADYFDIENNNAPVSAPVTITDFEHGSDTLYVFGSKVALVHDGAGHTGVFTDASSAIYVTGDGEPNDFQVFEDDFYVIGSSQGEVLSVNSHALGVTYMTGGGGADLLKGGSAEDIFRYTAVSDSTVTAPDYILGFQHGSDKIDVSLVDGGAVNIVHGGSGDSYVLFAPTGDTAAGLVAVVGDVEPGDLVTSSGAVVVVTGAFSPGPEPPADHPVYVA